MIVAIMQPYYFPYLGYFRLMHAADCFILYDDAQFMKGGWVNRNRILSNGEGRWWTFPVVHDDYRKAICDRQYSSDPSAPVALLRKIRDAYQRAPYFSAIYAWLSQTFVKAQRNVAAFNTEVIVDISNRLGLSCRISVSSDFTAAPGVGGVERVLDLCRRAGAKQYLNAPGGRALYDPLKFKANGLSLGFLGPDLPEYPQFGLPHVPNLSIIDALMFRSWEGTRALIEHPHIDWMKE